MIRISLIGTGLIGGSLGLALQTPAAQAGPLRDLQITGYDRDKQMLKMAYERRAINRQAQSLAEAVAQADLVILATPVQTVQLLLRELAPLLAVGTVVTDTASTKMQVNAWAAEFLPPGVGFVGGHPMAGREQAGAAAATADLFKGAVYCLTPNPGLVPQGQQLVEEVVWAVGAKPYYIEAAQHDAYVAGISHLPFLLSTALVEAVSQSPDWPVMSLLAAGGFRDVSRLASGDPQMHRDICLTNQAALVGWVDAALEALLKLRGHLAKDEPEQLDALFDHAKQVRDAWLAERMRGLGS